jgi:membrane protein implicated in regulation of membrane protease activity
MSWADFYLICFAVGFAFSFLSFFLGGIHWHFPFHLHLPFEAPHVHVGPHVHAAGHAHGHGAQVSAFNPITIAAFLAWFGGTGYLLSRFSTVRFVGELLLSITAGLVASAAIFLFMTRVLISNEENLDPADYEMVGVLGRITSPVREGGTGELVYSQAGTRRVCGVRSENGTAIAKGSEVVVTRYERGIAYVRRWEELAGEEQTSSNSTSNSNSATN